MYSMVRHHVIIIVGHQDDEGEEGEKKRVKKKKLRDCDDGRSRSIDIDESKFSFQFDPIKIDENIMPNTAPTPLHARFD